MRENGDNQRARLARVCKGEGETHLLIDDADVVLGAISFQGIN